MKLSAYCGAHVDARLLLCGKQINYRLKKEIGDQVNILDKPNPTTLMKAVKNPIEQENLSFIGSSFHTLSGAVCGYSLQL